MVVFSLTLVRHGETTANREKIIQGHTDVPLSERGQRQARLVASRLKNERFTHIFASDLKRAAETAQAIAEASTACECSVRLDSRLRERKFGAFEGKTFSDLHLAAEKQKIRRADFTPDGAESFDEVRKRAKQFFQELCELMAKEGSAVDGEYRPASIRSKRQMDGGLSNGSTPQDVPTFSSSPHAPHDQDLKESSGHKNVPSGNKHISSGNGHTSHRTHACPVKEDIVPKRARTDSVRQFSSDSVVSVIPCDCDSDTGSGGMLRAGISSASIARSNSLSSSSGCSSLQDSVECQDADQYSEEVRDTDSNMRDTDSGESSHSHLSPKISPGHILHQNYARVNLCRCGASSDQRTVSGESYEDFHQNGQQSNCQDFQESGQKNFDAESQKDQNDLASSRTGNSGDVHIHDNSATSAAETQFRSVCVISHNGETSVDPVHSINPYSAMRSDFNPYSVSRSDFCPPTMQLIDQSDQNWFGLHDGDGSPVFISSTPQSQLMCPNVSLSPLVEHRISSISSISSGRNSSFDDTDVIPMVVGEVLVVSHGGLLKELVAHFIEDFQCKVPGGKGHALRICPNTGVSRFMITLSEPDHQPAITCLLIHDKDHLASMSDVELPL